MLAFVTSTNQGCMFDLLNDDIPRTLKRMTIPMIFGMITLMSFNLVDTFFISLLGTKPLAAIGFTFPITFTVISLTIGLGIGTSAVIAKLRGRGDNQLADQTAADCLSLTVVLVILLSLFGYLGSEWIFNWLGASPETYPIIMSYMTTWFAGSVFLALPMVGNAVFRANGDTRLPSYFMAMGGICNAILDPLLIFGLGPFPEMGIQGAALASVLSWMIGSVLILHVLIFRRKLVSIKLGGVKTHLQAWRSVLVIALPAAGANMFTPLAMAVMTAVVARFGNEAVAAFGVGTRIESIASLVVLALSMTLPPLISQNFGAGQMHRVKQAYFTAIKFVMVWQLLVYLLLALTAHWVAGMFGDDPELVDLIKLFLFIVPLGYGLQGITILTNSSLNALHLPKQALVLSASRFFVFYIPLAYLLSLQWGMLGIFAGALIASLISGGVALWWFQQQLSAHGQQLETV